MSVVIGDRTVGPKEPVFVIAEAGVNHNGDLDLALRLVDAAAGAGADAVKFQTFSADRVTASDAPKAAYQIRTTGSRETQRSMLRRLELDRDAFAALAERARERGLVFLSSPFDADSATLLAELGVPAFKLGSGELTNKPLVEHVAGFGRPVILSTGMADLAEVEAAIGWVRARGAEAIVLHCTSSYPAPADSANVRAVATMAEALGVVVGYSDHTTGVESALAAVALGAALVERHLTLDRSLPGPDHTASSEPDELRAYVHAIRTVESTLGDGTKGPTEAEAELRVIARRSLHARTDLAAGTPLRAGDLEALRPAGGIPPAELDDVVGRATRRALRAGEMVRWEDIA